jgi:hypothetical protein
MVPYVFAMNLGSKPIPKTGLGIDDGRIKV